MPERWQNSRFAVATAVLAGAAVLLHAAGTSGNPPGHQPLTAFPAALGEWRGLDLPLTQRILEVAGADEYVNRQYTDAAGHDLQLYLGYYNSQRTGDLIHSPRNCLPAAGWEWVRTGRLTVNLAERPVEVNDFLIAKGLERQVVLYWYQGRGRAVASEYLSKFWMMADAISRRRTDGALVRIAAPLRDDESATRARAIAFARTLYPRLHEFIPD